MADFETGSDVPVVELRGVAKSYREGLRERPVFQDLDLCLYPGEVAALLGRSGSGKSTLLNLVAGLDQPDRGEVWLAGTSLDRLAERSRTRLRRQRIGFVFQFFNLIPTLTVLENLLLPLELSGVRRGDGERRARTLLEQVGLGARLDSFPEQLSGGEQQRVAIVRAVIHEPDLILADEPTGNLDESNAAVVLDLLLELVRTHRKTLLLVTHSRDTAACADRVWTVHAGRLKRER